MKKVWSYLVTVMFSIFVGYEIYPIVNSEQSIASKTTGSNKTLEQKSVIKLSPENNHIAKKHSELQSIEVSNVPRENLLIFDAKVDPVENSIETNVHPGVKKDLDEWAKIHKEQLSNLITDNFPTLIADSMTSIVLRDNDFLNNPKILQDTDKDVNWTYIMEQDLRHLIEQHPESLGFDLLQLTCKQLTCEIIGIEVEAGAWRKIFFSLLQTAPSIKLPDGNEETKNIIFSENNKLYIYSQLEFN